MAVLTPVKNYLWRTFEMESFRPPETIEKALSGGIIPEPADHSVPEYGKLFGTAGKGEFDISFVPLSSVFLKGVGRVSIHGKIEKKGRGSRITGCLPGPSFGLWILAAITLVFPFSYLFSKGFLQSPWLTLQTVDWLPLSIVEGLFALMTVILFGVDRKSNREGEAKILALLKEVSR
jgi:hypothetical protein